MGIVGQEINPALFTSTNGTIIAAIGHTVGEHVNFMQEVLTDIIDPDDVVHIVLDRGQITETNTVDGTFGGTSSQCAPSARSTSRMPSLELLPG